jgi:predicted component of type VI protein secretion system
VVETVDERSFVNASYQSVVERALTRDPPVLASQMVFPGSREEITFLSPSGGPIAVYALFTEPEAGGWKYLVQPPFPKKIHLRLAGNEIVRPAARRRWFVFW